MARKKRPIRVEKKMDSIYIPSLKVLIDLLFQEAYKQRWNWERLAKESGLSSSTVRKLGRYETRYPQFRTVQLIAHALGGHIKFHTGPAGRIPKVTWTPKVFDGRSRKVA
jgi:hypothetical protein